MRPEGEMLELILRFAQEDDAIRAVTMNGSRANEECVSDEYSDYDIQYLVRDIRPYVRDKAWIGHFGDVLILQEPDDWFSHPYDMDGQENYAFLIQFQDGNRIDITFVNVSNLERLNAEEEPRRLLLSKDTSLRVRETLHAGAFLVKRPTKEEFDDTVNEFLWLSLYVLKGIHRQELSYAKAFLDKYEIDLLYTMVSWKIGCARRFTVSAGKAYKNLKRYLPDGEAERLGRVYSDGSFPRIYDSLLIAIDLFEEYAVQVADALGFPLDRKQIESIKKYVRDRRPANA